MTTDLTSDAVRTAAASTWGQGYEQALPEVTPVGIADLRSRYLDDLDVATIANAAHFGRATHDEAEPVRKALRVITKAYVARAEQIAGDALDEDEWRWAGREADARWCATRGMSIRQYRAEHHSGFVDDSHLAGLRDDL